MSVPLFHKNMCSKCHENPRTSRNGRCKSCHAAEMKQFRAHARAVRLAAKEEHSAIKAIIDRMRRRQERAKSNGKITSTSEAIVAQR